MVSHLSVNAIFKDFPNVFTTQASQDDDRLPVMTQFIRRMKFERPAFVGLAEGLFSRNLGDGMKKSLGEGVVVADRRLRTQGDDLAPEDVAAIVAEVKEKQPDIVVLAIGTARTVQLMKAMMAADVDTGAVHHRPHRRAAARTSPTAYPNAIYQLAWDRLPEAYNDRLRRRIASEPAR